MSRLTVSDLDLTYAIDQAAQELLGQRTYCGATPTGLREFKQKILETVLPVLPDVIEQVEQRTLSNLAELGLSNGHLTELQADWIETLGGDQ